MGVELSSSSSEGTGGVADIVEISANTNPAKPLLRTKYNPSLINKCRNRTHLQYEVT